jgi:hypothetical protein
MVLLIPFHVRSAEASKLRSWLDSSKSLLEGNFPSPRHGHGLTSTDDGRIYTFGGVDERGTHFPKMCKVLF